MFRNDENIIRIERAWCTHPDSWSVDKMLQCLEHALRQTGLALDYISLKVNY